MFFFVQIIEFSSIRFYLPLLPFFCCLIAWGYTQFKTKLLFRLLFFFLYVIQIIFSIQFIMELRFNSSVALRNYYLGESSIKDKFIVCDGTDLGIQISYSTRGNKHISTLRNWSQSKFGYLSNCRSIDVNPLSIAMLLPDIVTSETFDDSTLLSINYKIIRNIKGYVAVFPSLYHFDTPKFQTSDISKYAIGSNAFVFLSESYKQGKRWEDLYKC
ncbi:MAG TPA: hypothetical protein DD381_02845 [Lentisphaeria bacterium]|nr:MAG: hypothetical protein A2X47_03410 [Lentisphaerae bacterium GWF2_38_69]HBM15272.1 hypothetical protein [Lentisphaeria bacterium]